MPNDVQGYFGPGALTALMDESGAGKTTPLKVLAYHNTTGVNSGDKIVDTNSQDARFTRRVGYAQ